MTVLLQKHTRTQLDGRDTTKQTDIKSHPATKVHSNQGIPLYLRNHPPMHLLTPYEVYNQHNQGDERVEEQMMDMPNLVETAESAVGSGLAKAQSNLIPQPPPQNPPVTSTPPRSQDVTIIPVSGPNLFSHGRFDWRILFALPAPAVRAGNVIQEIFRRVVENGRVTIEEHFWEWWPIPQNHIDTSPYQDVYLLQIPATMSGRAMIVGRVKFYEGPLPPEFGNPPRPTTIQRPAIWDGTGTLHTLATAWDYRPNRRHFNRLRAYDGTRFITIP